MECQDCWSEDFSHVCMLPAVVAGVLGAVLPPTASATLTRTLTKGSSPTRITFGSGFRNIGSLTVSSTGGIGTVSPYPFFRLAFQGGYAQDMALAVVASWLTAVGLSVQNACMLCYLCVTTVLQYYTRRVYLMIIKG